MRGHAAFPYAEYPKRIGHKAAQSILRQPVEKEFAQSPADEYAQNADQRHIVPQFLQVHLEEFFLGEPAQHQVAEHEACYIGEPIPADG